MDADSLPDRHHPLLCGSSAARCADEAYAGKHRCSDRCCDQARLLHRPRQGGRLLPDDHRQCAARALCRYRLQPRRGGVCRPAQGHQLPLPRSQPDREAVADVLEHTGVGKRPLVRRAADVPHSVHLRRSYHSPDEALPENESPAGCPDRPDQQDHEPRYAADEHLHLLHHAGVHGPVLDRAERARHRSGGHSQPLLQDEARRGNGRVQRGAAQEGRRAGSQARRDRAAQSRGQNAGQRQHEQEAPRRAGAQRRGAAPCRHPRRRARREEPERGAARLAGRHPPLCARPRLCGGPL